MPETAGPAVLVVTFQYDPTYALSTGVDLIESSESFFTLVDSSTAQTGDIDTISSGPLARISTTTPLNDSNYRDRNILGLAASVVLKDANGSPVSKTQMAYDETALQPYNDFGSDWIDPGAYRGNVTRVRRYIDASADVTLAQACPVGVCLETQAFFDQVGNVWKVKNARGIESQTEFSAAYKHAYSTQTTSAIPDSTGMHGSSTALVTSTIYDSTTGLVTSATDANGQTTTYTYNDPLKRLTAVTRPDTGSTTYIYNDTVGNLYVLIQTTQSASQTLMSYQFFDGLNRPNRSVLYENQIAGTPYLAVDTQYDNMGRAWQVSNPYRMAGLNDPPSGEWTTTSYDPLGRVTSVTTSDTAVVRTAYSGNRVLVTDQIGNQRISESNALGQLTEVWEVTSDSGSEFVSFPGHSVTAGYRTSYLYDVLGNLTRVTQGSQPPRRFEYDSLSRLTSATNPESGRVTYQYDNNGNLLVKTDARDASSHFSYDALDRVNRLWFNGSSSSNANINNAPPLPADVSTTSEVSYTYDQARTDYFNRGRLTTMTTAAVGAAPRTSVEFDYDKLGRVKKKREIFGTIAPSNAYIYDAEAFLISSVPVPQPATGTLDVTTASQGITYEIAFNYDLAGKLLSLTYPSGRTVNYGYDVAGGLNSFNGNLGDGVQRNYSTQMSYSPWGSLSQEKFGTDVAVYNKLFYNSRGQLAEIREGTTPNDASSNRGSIINHYSACWGKCEGEDMPDNNGNLKRQEHQIPDDEQGSSVQSFLQFYEYDKLNRLTAVHEGRYILPQQSSSQEIHQVFNLYDRWGNRTINAAQTTAGINAKQFTVNTSNNRLGVPAGQSGSMTYDAAGNLINDAYTASGSTAGSQTRFFDAENRMVSAPDSMGGTSRYSYDGAGRRMTRVINSAETWQVYGLAGELLAEYPAQGSPSRPLIEYGYRNGQLLITAAANVALASSGSIATASSSHASGNFPALAAINGDRTGANWGTSTGGWNDNTRNVYPDILEIQFPETKTIDEIDVFTLQNNWTTAGEPNLGSPATGEGILDFIVQYWCENNPSVCPGTPAWTTIPGGDVTGNDKAWRRFLFPAVTTTRIRVVVNNARNNWSRIVEVEAYQGGGTGVQWLVSDHLGTPRMIFDKTGRLANTRRHDYLPFGEELFAGQNGRTPAQGYTGDTVRQKFTSHERDNETGLDYMQARYCSSQQGRFTSADTVAGSEFEPQTMNLYAYVANNPLRYVDPTGHMLSDIGVYQTENSAVASRLESIMATIIMNHVSSVATSRSSYSSNFARNAVKQLAAKKTATFFGSGTPQNTGQEPAGGIPGMTVIGPPVINADPSGEEAVLRRWIDEHPNGLGTGWCAEFVQILAEQQGTPLGLAGRGTWRAGPSVSENLAIPRGTVIISGVTSGSNNIAYYPNFNDYGNHAAVLLRHLPGGGIRVLEQLHGKIVIRDVTDLRSNSYFLNPRAYYVLMANSPALKGVPAKRTHNQ